MAKNSPKKGNSKCTEKSSKRTCKNCTMSKWDFLDNASASGFKCFVGYVQMRNSEFERRELPKMKGEGAALARARRRFEASPPLLALDSGALIGNWGAKPPKLTEAWRTCVGECEVGGGVPVLRSPLRRSSKASVMSRSGLMSVDWLDGGLGDDGGRGDGLGGDDGGLDGGFGLGNVVGFVVLLLTLRGWSSSSSTSIGLTLSLGPKGSCSTWGGASDGVASVKSLPKALCMFSNTTLGTCTMVADGLGGGGHDGGGGRCVGVCGSAAGNGVTVGQLMLATP